MHSETAEELAGCGLPGCSGPSGRATGLAHRCAPPLHEGNGATRRCRCVTTCFDSSRARASLKAASDRACVPLAPPAAAAASGAAALGYAVRNGGACGGGVVAPMAVPVQSELPSSVAVISDGNASAAPDACLASWQTACAYSRLPTRNAKQRGPQATLLKRLEPTGSHSLNHAGAPPPLHASLITTTSSSPSHTDEDARMRSTQSADSGRPQMPPSGAR